MTERRIRWRPAAALVPLLVLALGAAPLAAQSLAPKRPPAEQETVRGCTATPPPAAPPAVRRDSAAALVAAASQAAILGDDGRARDLFRRAAALDPTDAAVAYRLARLHEDLGEPVDAAAEYCRYLALAPASPDAPEVAARVARLAPRRDETAGRAMASFREGLLGLDRGAYTEAEAAFTAALQDRPEWPEAHFNRGLALLGGRNDVRAAAELETYLRLSPGAPDAERVRETIRGLRSRGPGAPAAATAASAAPTAFSPAGSLARGLVVPGLGQFHTRRPALGAAVLAGAGAALYAAFRQEEVTRTATATDPFGNPYEYSYRATERPGMGAGIAAAAAITLAGAAEAYLYARRAGAPDAPPLARAAGRLELGTAPSGDGLRLGFRVGHDGPR
jgi:tetratricopeptide (TPR) repeat protein